jgi:peptidyl-prolyl cis-trans isomerase C
MRFRSVSAFAMLLFSATCAAQIGGAPSTVVVKQGDTVITLADIDAFAQGIPAKDRRGFFDNPSRLESMLTTLLLQKQLAAEARALGIDKDPGIKPQLDLAVEAELAKIRMQKFRTDLKIPDLEELAKEDFIAHKEKYQVSASVTVKHVLISTKNRSEDEARALAEKVASEAKANPAGFDALIDNYSDDPGKGGSHGVITDAANSKYAPEFSQASAALKKPGEISPVVKTSFGFHVIDLVSRSEARTRSFDEVKAEIVARLRGEYAEKQVKDHTDKIRNEPIDANQDLVASLRGRYPGSDAAVPAAGH